MSALLLYVATAGALLLIVHRFVLPLTRREAIALPLIPLAFTGQALFTGRIYAPIDVPYLTEPLKAVAKQFGIERVRNGAFSDVAAQLIPWRAAVRYAFAHHEWPLWNPFIFAGDILAASAQPAPYSPFNLLSLLIPLDLSLTYVVAANLLLAATGMFLLLRELDCRPSASLFGGAAFAWSNTILFWIHWPLGQTMLLLPLLFVAVRRLVRNGGRGSIAFVGVVLTLALLAGHPESVLLLVASGIAYAIFELIAIPRRLVAKRITGALVAGALALLVSALFILPILDAISWSSEHELRRMYAGIPKSQPTRVALSNAIAHAIPFFYGETWTPEGNVPIERKLPSTAYAGSILFALAIYAVIRSRRRERLFFAWAFILGVAFAIHLPGPIDWLSALPLFEIGINDRLLILAVTALPALAAIGIDHWMDTHDLLLPKLAFTTAVVLLAEVAIGWPSMRSFELPSSFIVSHALPLVLAPLFAGVVFFLPVKREVAIAILALLLLAERTAESYAMCPTLPRKVFYPQIASLTLPRTGQPFRIAGSGFALFPGTPTLYGIEDVRGYEAITFRGWAELQPAWSKPQFSWSNSVDDLTQPMLDFLGVRYALAEMYRGVPPGWRLVRRADDLNVLENTEALPRAFLPKRIVACDSDPIGQIAAEPKPAERVWLTREPHDGLLPHGRPCAEFDNATGSLGLHTDGLTFSIDSKLAREGWIVVSENGWPGWRAKSEGHRLKLRPANHAFIAIQAPAGKHRIELTYRPRSFDFGLRISGSALGFLILIGLGNLAMKRIARRG